MSINMYLSFAKKIWTSPAVYTSLSEVTYQLILINWLFFVLLSSTITVLLLLLKLPSYEESIFVSLVEFEKHFPEEQTVNWNGKDLILAENPAEVYVTNELKSLLPNNVNRLALLDTRVNYLEEVTQNELDPFLLLTKHQVGIRDQYGEYLPIDTSVLLSPFPSFEINNQNVADQLSKLTYEYTQNKNYYILTAASSYLLISLATYSVIVLYLALITKTILFVLKRVIDLDIPSLKIALMLSIPTLYISQISRYFFNSGYQFGLSEIFLVLLTFIFFSERNTLIRKARK